MKKLILVCATIFLLQVLCMSAFAFEVTNPNNEGDYINNPVGVIGDSLPNFDANGSAQGYKAELVDDVFGREGKSMKLSFDTADGSYKEVAFNGFHWHIVGNNAFEMYLKKTAQNDNGRFYFWAYEGGGSGTWESFKLSGSAQYLLKGTNEWKTVEVKTADGRNYVELPTNFDGWLHVENVEWSHGGTGDNITTFDDKKLAGTSFCGFIIGTEMNAGDSLIIDDLYAVNELGLNVTPELNPVEGGDNNPSTFDAGLSVAVVGLVAMTATIAMASKKQR